jgi:hypothetical protein
MLTALAAFLLAALQPPVPAGADAGCVIGGVPAEVRARALAEAATGTVGPVRAAFDAAARRCARERSWDAERMQRSNRLAAAWTVISEGTADLERKGLEPAIFLSWYREMAPNGSVTTSQSVSNLLDRYLAAGISGSAIQRSTTTLGLLIGAMEAVEKEARVPEGD